MAREVVCAKSNSDKLDPLDKPTTAAADAIAQAAIPTERLIERFIHRFYTEICLEESA